MCTTLMLISHTFVIFASDWSMLLQTKDRLKNLSWSDCAEEYMRHQVNAAARTEKRRRQENGEGRGTREGF